MNTSRSASSIIRPLSSSLTVRLLAVPALTMAGLFATPLRPAAAQPSLTCGSVVTTDVRLTADLHDCPGSGLVVGASGVTIDLAGHTIDGTGSGAGIDNTAGHDNLQVGGGTVREFLFGVELFEARGARINKLAAVANADGLKIAQSERVDIDQVVVSDNWASGIEITFSGRVAVRRSTAADNGLFGIVDRYSTNSKYVDNVLTGNQAPGLTVDRIDGVVLDHNRATANFSNGIEVVGIEGATLTGNVATANSGSGIYVELAGNTLRRNQAHDNHELGIAAPDGTTDGRRNQASGNLGGDCTGVTCR